MNYTCFGVIKNSIKKLLVVGSINNWINKKSLHIDATGFEINSKNAIDIDDLDDWKLAEAFLIQSRMKSLGLSSP